MQINWRQEMTIWEVFYFIFIGSYVFWYFVLKFTHSLLNVKEMRISLISVT